jgi:hypothetical protein
LSKILEKLKRFAWADGGLPLIWLALTVLLLIPVWNQRLLPMLDTPNDLALARAWHSFRDPTYKIAEFFTKSVQPVPGILFYFLVHLLMYVAPIEVANKIVLSAYLILFPLSVLALARALGRSPWLALGAFPLAFSRNWIFGYGGFLLGTVLAFFAFAALVRLLERGRDRDVLLLLLLSLGTYFAHVLTWLVFGLAAMGVVLAYGRSWRRGLSALIAIGPSVALGLGVYFQESADRIAASGEDWAATYRDFPTLVLDFPKRVLDIIPGTLDMTIFTVVMVTVLVLCIVVGVRVSDEEPRHRRLLPILIVALSIGYMIFPWEMQKPIAWPNCAARIAPMLAVALLMLPSGRIAGRLRFLFVPLVIASVVLPVRLVKLYRDFSRRNIGFVRLSREIPRGKRTLVLIRGLRFSLDSIDLPNDPASAGAVYWYWTAWPMAIAGGYVPYLFEHGVPVQYSSRLKAPKYPSSELVELRQAPGYDYYLVKGAGDGFEREPSLKIIDQFGEWTLFQRVYDMSDEP